MKSADQMAAQTGQMPTIFLSLCPELVSFCPNFNKMATFLSKLDVQKVSVIVQR